MTAEEKYLKLVERIKLRREVATDDPLCNAYPENKGYQAFQTGAIFAYDALLKDIEELESKN